MTSLPIGLLLMSGIVYFALHKTSGSVNLLNINSILLVLGGTVAVLATSNSVLALKNLVMSFRQFFQPEITASQVNKMLLNLSKDRATQTNIPHPLVTCAQEMWDAGVDDELFTSTLTGRLVEINHLTYQPVAVMRNLAKYPPALGMTGTVIGMIGLFSNLDESHRAALGPNLAMAMTATLYGLLLANGMLMPLADRLAGLHLRVSNLNEHIFKSIMLIHRREPESLLQGELDAYAA